MFNLKLKEMDELRTQLGKWLEGELTPEQEVWVGENIQEYLDIWTDMFCPQTQQEEWDQANSHAVIPEETILLWKETWV